MRRFEFALLLSIGAGCVPGEFGGSDPTELPPGPMASPSPTASPSAPPSPSASPLPEEPTFDDHWRPQDPSDQGPVDLVPIPPRDGKAARRMSIAQLRASIPALFGGITWTNNNRATGNPMFTTLSRTLGEPDYLGVTEENRDPNPIFAKFMDDMAGQVCANAVVADRTAAPGAQVIVPYATDVPRNLRFMRLKLHGIHVPDSSTEGLDELIALHAGIRADGGTTEQAWTGVCVAMLTAPEFMAY